MVSYLHIFMSYNFIQTEVGIINCEEQQLSILYDIMIETKTLPDTVTRSNNMQTAEQCVTM